MQDNKSFMLDQRIKTAAAITAACFQTDRYVFADALRRFFDMVPRDIQSYVHVDGYIDVYEYERIKFMLRKGKEYDVDYKSTARILLDPYDENDTIKTADNSVLLVKTPEELPSYEEYRHSFKEVCLRDLVSTKEFRENLAENIANNARHKALEWYDIYCYHLNKLSKQQCSEETIQYYLKKDYPFIVYV